MGTNALCVWREADLITNFQFSLSQVCRRAKEQLFVIKLPIVDLVSP